MEENIFIKSIYKYFHGIRESIFRGIDGKIFISMFIESMKIYFHWKHISTDPIERYL